jgi:hypothetical protein
MYSTTDAGQGILSTDSTQPIKMSSEAPTEKRLLEIIGKRQPKIIDEFFKLREELESIQWEALFVFVKSGKVERIVKNWKMAPDSEVPAQFQEQVQAIRGLKDDVVGRYFRFRNRVTLPALMAYWELAEAGNGREDIKDKLESAQKKRKVLQADIGLLLTSMSRGKAYYETFAIGRLSEPRRQLCFRWQWHTNSRLIYAQVPLLHQMLSETGVAGKAYWPKTSRTPKGLLRRTNVFSGFASGVRWSSFGNQSCLPSRCPRYDRSKYS